MVAAICAAPLALTTAGVFPGASVTCYPGLEEKVGGKGGHFTVLNDHNVVVSAEGKLVTSRGPGTACEFALKLVELLCSPEIAKKVQHDLLL